MILLHPETGVEKTIWNEEVEIRPRFADMVNVLTDCVGSQYSAEHDKAVVGYDIYVDGVHWPGWVVHSDFGGYLDPPSPEDVFEFTDDFARFVE